MKTVFSLNLVFLFLMAVVTSGSGQTIVGSAHDFSSASWNTTGQICIVCHGPHNTDVTVQDAPLWNHQLTVATFTPYSSASMNATVGQPDASSKLCLSCHDGTVAVDNFGGNASGTFFLIGSTLIGTDLSDDHPVSFTYDAALALADGGLADPTITNSGLGGTIDQDLLIGHKVQCASCHDVHNSSGIDNLLIKSNAQSGLCLTCHTL
jgi:predicted CXXCH cytochrome family protein